MRGVVGVEFGASVGMVSYSSSDGVLVGAGCARLRLKTDRQRRHDTLPGGDVSFQSTQLERAVNLRQFGCQLWPLTCKFGQRPFP